MSRRRLLLTVAESILLYGCEIWIESLKQRTVKLMKKVQRMGALRIACAYRTVSEPAIMVIGAVIPVHLRALERNRIWIRKTAGILPAVAKREER